MNIVLFGFKGVGKSYYGKRVAEKLGRTFIDTDHLIENLFMEQQGKRVTCKRIFQELGPIGFRALENEVVQSLQDVQNSVISLGAGAALDSINIDFLRPHAKMIWLDLNRDDLKKRILEANELPAYLDPHSPDASFDLMYEKRQPLYEKISAKYIDVTGKKDEDVVQEICSILNEEKSHGE